MQDIDWLLQWMMRHGYLQHLVHCVHRDTIFEVACSVTVACMMLASISQTDPSDTHCLVTLLMLSVE